MSGTRFARAGRWRLLLCLSAFILMFGMIALFHNQQELDEKREQRLRSLNEQLQSIIEQKYQLEKNHENERMEQMQSRHELEQKLKGIKELKTSEQLRFDTVQQANQKLAGRYNELQSECNKNKKQQLEQTSAMEKKLQALQTELLQEKQGQSVEINLWREKYNAAVQENKRLEVLLNASNVQSLQKRIKLLEETLSVYERKCDYKMKKLAKKPVQTLDEPRIVKTFSEQVSVSPGLYHIGVKETNRAASKSINVTTAIVNTNHMQTTTQVSSSKTNNSGGGGGGGQEQGLQKALLPLVAQSNGSLILHSVENFQILPAPLKKLSEEAETQIKQQPEPVAGVVPAADAVVAVAGDKMASPLSAPRKPTSTEATKSEKHVLEPNMAAPLLQKATNSSTSSSTVSSLAPLPLPPNQRKLPDNVAPIPANFEDLLKNDAQALEKANGAKEVQKKSAGDADAADIDAAVEDMQKNENENDDANNNRYANVVNDMEAQAHKAQKAAAANEDSGAHEIKDHDFVNEQNFNLPAAADEDGNFFDGAAAAGAEGGAKNEAAAEPHKKDEDEDDDMLGVGGADTGDIAVKNHDHLLDEDNLNNEVARDQGKEFPGDGLRLDDPNEEEEDEDDDYSNLAARQQGAQAIRN